MACTVASTFVSARVASAPATHSRVNAKSASFAGVALRAQSARFTASVKAQSAVAAEAAVATPLTSHSQGQGKQDAEQLGEDLWNKSYYPKLADHEQVNKPWYIVDAEGQTLGRLATMVAGHLRGANLPTYTPSVDMGGYVVVINCEKVVVTGNKSSDKLYRRHTTGRPGKMKVETFNQVQARIPQRIIEKAVKGMLPKGRLGRTLFTHLKVIPGTEHPHSAQQPVDITSQINKGTIRLAPVN